MGRRECIVEFLPVLLVMFLLAHVGFHDVARGRNQNRPLSSATLKAEKLN